jgi:tetratricopeptide (TPR) repeat protein/Tfp pilus assembly protein PilF
MSNRGPINPYKAGPPITTPFGFFGRDDLVEDLVTTLTTARQNAIVLHGQRRIGKSSLLHRLRRDEILQRDYLPIFLDLQIHKGASLAHILADLALTISEELDLVVSPPDEVSLVGDYAQFQRTFLPEIYRQLGNKRLLILLDEFDVVMPPDTGDPSLADFLPNYLRRLIEEEQSSLAVIFVIGRRRDAVPQAYQRLFATARTEPVGRLKQSETFDLLTQVGRQGDISYDDDTLSEIWALTNGQPYLTQLIGSEIFDRLQGYGRQQASVEDVTACLDKAMEHGQGGLDWFWSGFNFKEQLILAAVAELTNQQPSTHDAEIDKCLQQHRKFLRNRDRRHAYQQLVDDDLLLKTDQQRYQFTVEFIRRWTVKYHRVEDIEDPQTEESFQLGISAFEDGNLPKAIEYFRQALILNPIFVDAHLALARALRARGEIVEAIDEYEKAYALDPASARDELIDVVLDYARELRKTSDDRALEQVRRILKIDAEHTEARRLFNTIYWRQINTHLANDNPDRAFKIAQTLIQSLSHLDDTSVKQSLRELWLRYIHRLTQQDARAWDLALTWLDKLELLGLLDDRSKAFYNQTVLGKAQFLLQQEELSWALETLSSRLKDPLPVTEIKRLLLDYSSRQIEGRRWPNAVNALQGLCQLINDEESRATWQNVYNAWGDTLVRTEKFDEAIAIYQQGKTKGFDLKPKIAQAYVQWGDLDLAQHQFAEVEARYRQALAIQNTQGIRQEVQKGLITYFRARLREQKWALAEGGLKILQNLALAGDDGSGLQKELRLAQAKDELARGQLDITFQYLAKLVPGSEVEIKNLVKSDIQGKARSAEWPAGAAVLKRLDKLLENDQEIITWRVNWLFTWAKSLIADNKTGLKLARAKCLCQKIAEIMEQISFEPAFVDFLSSSAPETQFEREEMRPQVYELWVSILLDLARYYLDLANLTKALDLLERVLRLPHRPTGLQEDILTRLLTASQDQLRQEKWELARDILEIGFELGIPHDKIVPKLAALAINQARILFKHDEPDLAFSIIHQVLPSGIQEEYRGQILRIGYEFSRLYAGRDRWPAATQALKGLHRWLTSTEATEKDGRLDDIAKVDGWLDDLNREWLAFVRGKGRRSVISPEEIEYLRDEAQVAKAGYEDATRLELATVDAWVEDSIKACLALGLACLANGNLAAAIEAYQKVLDLGNYSILHRAQISQSLHNYSQRMADQGDLIEARLALEKLKEFNLPAPDGQACPDPRLNGALQQVILRQVRVLLRDHRVEEVFAQLSTLPSPKPEGEVKEIIFDYRQECCAQDKWSHAIAALEQLDQFLTRRREQTRDKETLEWLVDTVARWGQHLMQSGDLAQAIDTYDKGLKYTRQVIHPRNTELAGWRIRLTLELAHNYLKRDPLTSQTPPILEQTLRRYQEILKIPEHQPEHEGQIQEALHNHALKLSERKQWMRAYHMLDCLDDLYPTPRSAEQTLFAQWRRDLSLAEVRQRLEDQELDDAFVRLDVLKNWLERGHISQVTWPDTAGKVKTLVNDICQSWLRSETWEPATQALERLTYILPTDRDIKGWEVEALFRWAQWFRSQNRREEALARYEHALRKAPHQSIVPIAQIERAWLDTQLARAQQRLENDELSAAVAIYEQVLERSDDYDQDADQIRLALKDYSDSLTRRTPPDWKAAHQALDSLIGLKVDNDHVLPGARP